MERSRAARRLPRLRRPAHQGAAAPRPRSAEEDPEDEGPKEEDLVQERFDDLDENDIVLNVIKLNLDKIVIIFEGKDGPLRPGRGFTYD